MLRYILTIFAVLAAFTACREEGDSLSTTGKEKGRLVLGAISIEAEETHTRAVTIPKPQPEEVIIEIIDPDNFVVESGNIDHYANGIELFVAQYTLRAYYGNKQTMGDSPYFEGTVTFSVTEGATTQIGTITAKLANAIIIPNIPTSIVDHFIGVPTFYVSKEGEEKRAVTNGQALYVLPGEYTLSLEGTNKAGIKVEQIITNLNAQAQMVYNINCDLTLPKLELPTQAAGSIWATHLYLNPVITKLNGAICNTPKGLIYEIKTENSAWESKKVETLHEKEVLTNLSAKTTYQLRARVGDIISNVTTITTEEKLNIGNSSFEEWTQLSQHFSGGSFVTGGTYNFDRIYNEPYSSDNRWWTSNNNETVKNPETGSNLAMKCFPSTDKVSGRNGGYAAQIRGLSLSKFNSDTGMGMQGGKINGNLSIIKHPFKSRPNSIWFYYQYYPVGSDIFQFTVEILDAQNSIIATGKYNGEKNSSDINTFTPISIDLTYTEYEKQAAFISMSFISSATNDFDCERQTVTIGGEGSYKIWTGSNLIIDDIELIYE